MIKLTEGERKVLAATDGRPLRVIAAELGMSERNVKYYSDALRHKFNVAQRWELVEKRREVFGQ